MNSLSTEKDYAYVYIIDAALNYDKKYIYAVLPSQKPKIEIGSLCVVPFGMSNGHHAAVVVGFENHTDYDNAKPVFDILSYPVVPGDEILKLCNFIKERCMCTFGSALKIALPPGITIKTSGYYTVKFYDVLQLSEDAKFIYDFIRTNKKVSEMRLISEFGTEISEMLSEMRKKNVIAKTSEVKKHINEKNVVYYRLKSGNDELEPSTLQNEKQRCIVSFLLDGGCLTVSDGEELFSAGRSSFNTLEKNQIIEKFELRTDRSYIVPDTSIKYNDYTLSNEQQSAFKTISELMDSGEPKAALLYGVTGSGKTKVIIESCKKAISDGKTAMVLLPEIGLTAQALGIYQSVFGDRLAVVHSMLSTGERLDTYRKIDSGAVDIVIGTRSAIFSPLKNIGLIVLDEEQEYTYKSEMSPKYHTRDIARFRCNYNKAVMLLCSATPSVESFFKAQKNVYTLIKLENRYGDVELPNVVLADMRSEKPAENMNAIGDMLKNGINAALSAGEQVILFANRRGYNSRLSCMKCGYNFSCPNCSVSMTYHAYGLPYRAKKLVCHYCGYTKDVPDECPDCKSKNIGYFGYGTQKLEDELTTLFPSAKAVRMDADTTAFKSSHAEILNAFAKHEYDILFGTQMVAKGLDFPNVSLVGVINADASLYMNDFRAGERTFSLFTQLVGRSGRSKKRGNAIIQTFSPDNEILRLAVKQDYEKFYQSEIVLRKAVVFPPFCDIAVFSFSSQTESDTNSAALVLTCEMREYYEKNEFTFPWTLLGPYNAGILKLKNRYRQSVIIKYRDSGESRMFLHNVYALLLKSAPTIIKIDLDINPSIV